MLLIPVALGYLMTCTAQIGFFLEDTDMRPTIQHLIGKDNCVYLWHACNRGGSYDFGLQTETSEARSSTELGISTSESSQLESTTKRSTTETSWSSLTETTELRSTQATSSDSTEFSTTSIEPRTTESGSTQTTVSGSTGTTEPGGTETESVSIKTNLPEYAPRLSEQREPKVRAQEGGKATLRCFLHGNPPPRIIWRYGEITIEGDIGRYRLLSDGALEIVPLYRNDTGVYICVADNGLGVATLEIRLEVLDPVEGPAGISGTTNAVVVGEMGSSLSIRCLAYGYPQPAIFWYLGQDGPMVPYSSSLYEARGNVLQIRKLMPETLGKYICQAYNGYGKPAHWAVVVQAYRPEEYPYMVTRQTERSVTPYEHERQTEPTKPIYTVPVRTRITTDRTRLSSGSEINLPCDVDGFPVPEVYWTKDGVQIQRQPADDRIYVTEARLTITRANSNDSGVYGCHANNGYSSDYSTVQISVEASVVYIPANCKDSLYFANCNLIVKSKSCSHNYYSKFCCKSCLEAGQLDPNEMELLLAEMRG